MAAIAQRWRRKHTHHVLQHEMAVFMSTLRAALFVQLMSCGRLQGTMTGQAIADEGATPPHHAVGEATAVVAHLQGAGAATAGQLSMFWTPSPFARLILLAAVVHTCCLVQLMLAGYVSILCRQFTCTNIGFLAYIQPHIACNCSFMGSTFHWVMGGMSACL